MTDTREPGAASPDERAFLRSYPSYESTDSLDRLRRVEYARIDEQGHVYLDFTGGSLYADSQVHQHCEMLRNGVFGNPHSSNPSSTAATELVERTRRDVLRWFNASEDEYVVVFTANASNALKLVGESYPFERGDNFLLTFDNHNSVNGIREFDRAHGARTTYIPMGKELRVDESRLHAALEMASGSGNNLFAYPAQSNFSGVQHPLEWIEAAQAKGWDVLLDAAAFVPTNRLDLSRWHPDFVALSFYKMFGYPTGAGALIGRRSALARLHRPWFAGGTISVASVQADRYILAEGAAAFEDGTLDYLSIPAIGLGLEILRTADIDVIHERVRCLTGWLISRLLGLKHANGEPLVILYGPASTEARGGTVTMNFRTADGNAIDQDLVESRANEQNISLRTGCFCNPGAGESAMGISRDELDRCFSASDQRMTYEDLRRCIDGKSTGAVRVSLGLISNLADVERFVALAASFLE